MDWFGYSHTAAEGATPVIAQARYHPYIQNSGETGPHQRRPAPKGQEAGVDETLVSKLSGKRTEGRIRAIVRDRRIVVVE
jgi:hypothetical protein